MVKLDQQLSATSLRCFCDVAIEAGMTKEACLAGTGLSYEALLDPDLKPKGDWELRVVKNMAKGISDSVGLGVLAGQKMHVHSFGAWGFAILTSPTLRESIQVAIDYLAISFVLTPVRLEHSGDLTRIVFDLSGLPPQVRAIYSERYCMVAIMFMRSLLSRPIEGELIIESCSGQASYAEVLSDLIGVRVIAQQDRYALVLPSSLLDEPVPKSDPATLRFCLEQCEALVRSKVLAEKPWTKKVHSKIVDNIATEQRIEAVAESLAITDRTLRRRLADEGTNFRSLYTDIRLTIAHELLESAGLNVDTVSWRVGYAESASFTRAFSKQFGIPPGEVKKQARLQ